MIKIALHESLQTRRAMNLIEQILDIIIQMQVAFSQERSFRRFISIVFAILCMAGRHTITSFIYFMREEKEDWSKMYRFFSKRKWKPEVCFDKVAEITMEKILKKYGDILIAIDDFRVEKVGKTIPHARYQLDPKSPPFHPNLMWGHRYLHATLLVARKKRGLWQAARSISIRIKLAPHMKKPGKKATDKDWEIYETNKKEHNLNLYAGEMIEELRKLFDRLGFQDKPLVIVADGAYCNKTIFRILPSGVELIVRCRKDAQLCNRSTEKRTFYGENKFSPHDLYKDATIASRKTSVFYGRRTVQLKYKEKSEVYWQRGAQRRPLRNIVVYGVKYRRNKNGYTNYRDPMYLLTTSKTLDARTIIQYYLFRWEIEVNHRELKNNLGISQAQVVNAVSVKRCPQVVALTNSIVHLAYILLDEKDDSCYLPAPKWDKNRKRISLEYLRRRIRKELIEDPGYAWLILDQGVSWRSLLERVAA
jgi:hypothetical protein